MNRNSLCYVVQALNSEYVGIELNHTRTRHILTGFGKVNAAVCLMSVLCNEKPDFVINIGTAGSFYHRVGDIVVCDRFVDRDLLKLKALDAVYQLDDSDYRAFFSSIFEFNGFGICSTGDQFVTEPQGDEDVFDMEAFAYSRVCRMFDIPFVSVKYVTDKIGENSVKAWADKLSDARIELAHFFDTVIIKKQN